MTGDAPIILQEICCVKKLRIDEITSEEDWDKDDNVITQ